MWPLEATGYWLGIALNQSGHSPFIIINHIALAKSNVVFEVIDAAMIPNSLIVSSQGKESHSSFTASTKHIITAMHCGGEA